MCETASLSEREDTVYVRFNIQFLLEAVSFPLFVRLSSERGEGEKRTNSKRTKLSKRR